MLYKSFCNFKAKLLDDWAREENNRVKASHIARVAQRMEARYRRYNQDATYEYMERTLSGKRLDRSRDVGRPGWVDYVQARYAEWHDRRYGQGYPPSKRTMIGWMDNIIDVTVRIAIKQGVL